MQIAVTIPGNPIPKERPRVVRGRTYTPPRTAAFEALVRAHVASSCHAWRISEGVPWPRDQRYSVVVVVVRETRATCDLDNLAKSILDGAIGGWWADDSQIDGVLIMRGAIDKERPRVTMMATVIEPAECVTLSAELEAEMVIHCAPVEAIGGRAWTIRRPVHGNVRKAPQRGGNRARRG